MSFLLFSGGSLTGRACGSKQENTHMGCETKSVTSAAGTVTTETCVCDDKDFCNGAVMTSSFGHVIVVVALVVSVIVCQLM